MDMQDRKDYRGGEREGRRLDRAYKRYNLLETILRDELDVPCICDGTCKNTDIA